MFRMKIKTKIGGLLILPLVVSAMAAPLPAAAKVGAEPVEMIWPGGWGKVELIIREDRAELVSHELGGTTRRLRLIATPEDALAVLADERLAFTWPALLNWAGDDLHVLHDRALARAKEAADGIAKSLPAANRQQQGIGGDNRATLQYVELLTDVGHIDEAAAFAKERLASLPSGSPADYMRSSLNSRIAGLLFRDGTSDQAIEGLQKSIKEQTRPTPFQINEKMTLVELLAISGRYEEALAALDEATEAFKKLSPGLFPSYEQLPGSMAYFPAMRACALYGLGRKEEALALFARIKDQPGQTSTFSAVEDARLKGISCTRDPDLLAAEIAQRVMTAPPAGDIMTWLQRTMAFGPSGRVRKQAMSREIVIKAMAGRVRLLGGPLAPALRGWMPEASVSK
ncbi:hypothetical protein [Novosphingobium sp. SG707]|uniref:tetratricopeptide repeat protein n=1 Tax=Novosphingobium sp. SG707 TaxID=2586996 RepID=UPI001444CFBD|nr:hypothetical protein [Novosphingobium sp. SG707]NKJ02882.1 tetratricopeptide (TPR) repeat protein [Novosphingobium sp. SG707]